MTTVHIDETSFQLNQKTVLLEILVTIRDALIELGIPEGPSLREATNDLAFSVACIFDGSRVLKNGNGRVFPTLAFAGANGWRPVYKQLLISSEGSYMHECLDDDILDEAFKKSDS